MASSSTPQTESPENPEELQEILIPANTHNISVARRTLVGKVLNNKQVNKTAAKEIIGKAWEVYNNLQISHLGRNRFLFTFDSEEHTKKVMGRAPWFIMNHLLCLQYWIPEVSPQEIYFDMNPFWIQVHNLPMEFLNITNVATILKNVGTVTEIEESIVDGRILKTFIRAKVQVDVTKPLPTGCWVPRKDLPKIWVIYMYERLQGLCFNCGILGHDQRTCKTPRAMSAYCNSIPKYDQCNSPK